jgi:hypothetical protein
MSNERFVLPVIHYLDDALALRNAEIAFDAGANGVFVISMEGDDEPVVPAARLIKDRWPDRIVGVNLLSLPATDALERSLAANLDATWTDRPGVSSAYIGSEAFRVADRLKTCKDHLFFGSVAFKYQADEPHPGAAARRAAALGMIATTSGTATGIAPDTTKTATMKKALADAPLALASGVTPDNVESFLASVSYFLVATGISVDEHHLDPALCQSLISKVQMADALSRG